MVIVFGLTILFIALSVLNVTKRIGLLRNEGRYNSILPTGNSRLGVKGYEGRLNGIVWIIVKGYFFATESYDLGLCCCNIGTKESLVEWTGF